MKTIWNKRVFLKIVLIPISETGTPYSRAEIAVHLPVPFFKCKKYLFYNLSNLYSENKVMKNIIVFCVNQIFKFNGKKFCKIVLNSIHLRFIAHLFTHVALSTIWSMDFRITNKNIETKSNSKWQNKSFNNVEQYCWFFPHILKSIKKLKDK